MKILFKMKLQTDLNTEMDVNLILVSLFQFVEFSVIGGNIQGKFQVIRSWWIVWIQMLCKADSLKPQCNGGSYPQWECRNLRKIQNACGSPTKLRESWKVFS